MNWELFAAFLLITVVLVLTPGPIVTLVIATGAAKGMRAALVTVAGTSAGNAVLLAAIAFGLSWILSSAVYVFEILRWVGATYLIWLGILAWRGAAAPEQPRPQAHLRRGFLVALSNPKTIEALAKLSMRSTSFDRKANVEDSHLLFWWSHIEIFAIRGVVRSFVEVMKASVTIPAR